MRHSEYTFATGRNAGSLGNSILFLNDTMRPHHHDDNLEMFLNYSRPSEYFEVGMYLNRSFYLAWHDDGL